MTNTKNPAWTSTSVNRVTFILAAVALSGGVIGQLSGHADVASLLWAATTLLALLPLIITVIRRLLSGKAGVDFIALLAMAGALILHEYLAGAVIAFMLTGGRGLEDFAASRARRELSALVERTPRIVHRYEGDVIVSVAIEVVRPGDLLLIKPGEVVPVDGVVAAGTAVLDESALTGEADRAQRKHGDRVHSGTTNAAGTSFDLQATTTSTDSTYAGIVRLVTQAQESKAPLVRLADRYALLFLPFTIVVALIGWLISGDPVRALAVLVVATPCPLILAAPIAIVAGVSRAAHRGIIVKGGAALETLARAKTLFLDKTGTVTTGTPALTNIESFGRYAPDRLLQLAASLDQVSPHVLAEPILKAAADRGLQLVFPSEVSEEHGSGIRGKVDGLNVELGKSEWVLRGTSPTVALRRLHRRTLLEGSSGAFIAIDGTVEGALILEDPLRPDAPLTLRALRRAGFEHIVMLTGDHQDVARSVGAILGVNQVLAERSPAEKLEAVQAAQRLSVTVMVGDGINDAAALAAADVGVAMGARGATASSEAADIVLVVDRLDRLVEAIQIARQSRTIALQSVLMGMGMSMIAMGFAAGGFLTPVVGALLQEAIDLIVILNALRALRDHRVKTKDRSLEPGFGERCREEHRELWPDIKRIRYVADQLDVLPPGRARSEIEQVHRFLVDKVIPHNAAEETAMYPIVARLIGGDDPTAPMSRMHLEIAHMVRVLGRHLSELPPEGPRVEDLRDLRRILYGLDAILRIHFTQEDQAYIALLDDRPAA
jgi:heavy metal translocating P-type ATPase